MTTPKYPPVRYEVSARGGIGEVTLYGVIGDIYDGITSAKFLTDLKNLGGVSSINIHINSPGGIVREGRAIYNRLRDHPAKKVVTVDGEASSAAALIAMAGDEIRMAEGSLMLVHRAKAPVFANADELASVMRDLETIDAAQVDTYCRRTKMKPDAMMALMREDRYMSASEAVRLGFADIEIGTKITALAVDRPALGLKPLPIVPPRMTRAEARARMMRLTTTYRPIRP